MAEGQNFQFRHPSSQFLIKFYSNVPTNKGLFSEIHYFEFSVSNEIVNLSFVRPIFMKICTFVLFWVGNPKITLKIGLEYYEQV